MAESLASHRCPHCGRSNGWRGPLRDRVRFEGGVSRAQGRCRHCNGPVQGKEAPMASAMMGVALVSMAVLFAHRVWLLSPWAVLAGMAAFSASVIVWLVLRVSGRGFVLKADAADAVRVSEASTSPDDGV